MNREKAEKAAELISEIEKLEKSKKSLEHESRQNRRSVKLIFPNVISVDSEVGLHHDRQFCEDVISSIMDLIDKHIATTSTQLEEL